MASLIYDSFLDDLSTGAVVPSTDTYFVMLVTSSYTAAKTTDTKRSNVTNEVTATGYTAAGSASACTVAKNTGSNTETYTFADVVWTITGNLTARGAVIYKSRGGASSADNLVAYVDFGADKSCSDSTFTVHFTGPITFQN
jgi:hypothetical protein